MPNDSRFEIGVRVSDIRTDLALLPYVTPSENGWFNIRGRFVEVRVRLFDSGPGQQFSSPTLCDLTLQNHIGDMNCDGAINNFDIDLFTLALASSPDFVAYYAVYPDCYGYLADCNGDGRVNNFDIDAFISLLSIGPVYCGEP